MEIAEVQRDPATSDFPGMPHVPAGHDGAEVDDADDRQHDQRGRGVGVDQPVRRLAGQHAPADQHQADRHQPHPDHRGDAETGQGVGLDIVGGAQQAGCDQDHVLRDPDDHQTTHQRPVRCVGTRLERRQDEQPGEQGGDDQGIGAAMGVFGQAHIAGKRRAAPQEGDVQAVLEREDRIEDDQGQGDRAGQEG